MTDRLVLIIEDDAENIFYAVKEVSEAYILKSQVTNKELISMVMGVI